MELWVRSQDKEKLIKVNNIEIFHHYSYKDTQEKYLLPSGSFEWRNVRKKDKYKKSVIACNDEITLGAYKSKERALEVLDEIQDLLKPIYNLQYKGVLSKNDLRKFQKMNEGYITNDNSTEIKPLNNSVLIYEMPEE